MSRMTFVGVAAACIGLTLLVENVFGNHRCGCCCPEHKPSTETKACHTDVVLCGGALDATTCNTPLPWRYEVLDFPKSCIETSDQTKCNEPNANCYRRVTCKWEDGVCVIDAGQTDWTSKTKPTVANC